MRRFFCGGVRSSLYGGLTPAAPTSDPGGSYVRPRRLLRQTSALDYMEREGSGFRACPPSMERSQQVLSASSCYLQAAENEFRHSSGLQPVDVLKVSRKCATEQ